LYDIQIALALFLCFIPQIISVKEGYENTVAVKLQNAVEQNRITQDQADVLLAAAEADPEGELKFGFTATDADAYSAAYTAGDVSAYYDYSWASSAAVEDVADVVEGDVVEGDVADVVEGDVADVVEGDVEGDVADVVEGDVAEVVEVVEGDADVDVVEGDTAATTVADADAGTTTITMSDINFPPEKPKIRTIRTQALKAMKAYYKSLGDWGSMTRKEKKAAKQAWVMAAWSGCFSGDSSYSYGNVNCTDYS